MRNAGRAGLAVLVLALSACSVAPTRSRGVSDYALARQSKAAGLDRWQLSGRVAVSDGREGGSGRFDWTQEGTTYVMTIRAPVSNQTWRLSGDERQARLEGVGPVAIEGTDPEELLAREVGWRFPVRQMRNWVRAIPYAAGAATRVDGEGLPKELREAGWTLQYRSYDRGLDPPMPTRIAANRAPYKVRLAISSWTLDE